MIMPSSKDLLDKKILACYLTYQFVPKPFSLGYGQAHSKDVHQFPTTYDARRIFQHDEKWIATSLFAQLNDVVKTTIGRTKGPIGLLFSGGLDSTILLYLLRENTSRDIHTVSGAYSGDRSHLQLCRLLAKKYNTVHHECIITSRSLKKLGDLYSKKTNDPIGDNGFLATRLMFDRLAPYTKTVFTGDGADCLFHGLGALDLGHRNIWGETFFSKREAFRFLDVDVDPAVPFNRVLKSIRTRDPVKKKILLDLNFLVVNRIEYILQANADRTKVILPYLAPALIDFVLRVPSGYFIKGPGQKYILKKAFEDVLPKVVILQKKRGMTPPFDEWYAQNKAFLSTTLEQAVGLGVSPEYIRYLLVNIKSSRRYEHGMRIWLMLNLVLWYQRSQSRRA
jgi:asparagine synthase (glutamine-hydrolysing)